MVASTDVRSTQLAGEQIVRLMLKRDMEEYHRDQMGRMAIHFAAARSVENFRAICDVWAGGEVADKIGRTTLHWASIGGMEVVVYRLLSLSDDSVNQGDRDGWTPLLWAARGSDTEQRELLPREQEEVIKLLLDRDADPYVRGKGLDQEWSPVKVAKYHGVDRRVIQLLEKKAKEKLEAMGSGNAWDAEFHASRKAARKDSWCGCCFSVSKILTMSPASVESLFDDSQQYTLTFG